MKYVLKKKLIWRKLRGRKRNYVLIKHNLS